MDAKEEGNSTTTTTATTTTTTTTKPTPPKLPRKRKRSFFLLTSCFCGSGADPEASQKPSGDVGSKKNKRKFSRFSWFSWSPFKKKKKKKKKEKEKSIPYVKASAKQQLKAKSTKTRSITQVNVNASQQQPSILLTNSSRILEPIQSETRSNQPGSTGRFEREAGLWVMLMTLALIVFFGRVTAVVVLCTFFYLIPFLRVPASDDGAAATASAAASGEVDVDSEGYKKRIVLGGLLERDSRRHSRVYVTS